MEIIYLMAACTGSVLGICAAAAVAGVLHGLSHASWASRERKRINAQLDAHEQANVDAWPNPFADYA